MSASDPNSKDGHVNLNSGGGSTNSLDRGGRVAYSSRIRSPPPQEQLNNGGMQHESQTNLNLSNGGSTIPGVLIRKVPNEDSKSKKGILELTHLPARPPVEMCFRDLSYSVSEGRKRGYKTILKGINGTMKAGTLTAIMGPSGAGKSTLMNILAGYRTKNLTGSVLINDKERNLRRFRKLSCYIMQDDCLLPHLTVSEAITVSANLKLGKDVSKESKKIVIKEIIETLGLEECRNTRTINLSGGQRKRLSIALELVNNPPIMFFDEPTSGLDSRSCFQCIGLLKTLARGGRTIICTIHQPSARLFEMFDYLYCLAEGQCIYKGSIPGLVPFLSSMGLHCPPYHNPADYLMEVASNEHGECVTKLVMAVNNGKCNNYQLTITKNTTSVTNTNNETTNHSSNNKDNISKHSSGSSQSNTSVSQRPETVVIDMREVSQNSSVMTTDCDKKEKEHTINSLSVINSSTLLLESNEGLSQPIKPGFTTSTVKQFWILLKRTFLSIVRDQTLTHLRLVSHTLVGLLIGLLYFNIGDDAAKMTSNAGCIFFTVLFTMFTAMMPTILTFPMEMSVFVREHLNYWYSLKAFYFAKTIADLPFQIVFSGLYVLIVYYMSGQPIDAYRVTMFSTINILTALVSQSVGLLIGAAMRIETAVYLGPVTTIPVVLFSGFFVTFDTIPTYLHWLTYLSYVRYGFEGAMLSIYGFDRPKLSCSEVFCRFRIPIKFLEELSMDQSSFWLDVGALIAIFVFLRVITYFVLVWKIRVIK